MKQKIVVGLLTFICFTFTGVESFAGTASDEYVKVTWKDLKKSAAKGMRSQNFKAILLPDIQYDWFSVKVTIYNDDGEELLAAMEIRDGRMMTKKTLNLIGYHFTGIYDSHGPGPYIASIDYRICSPALPGGGCVEKVFETKYKFKK
jgi:hypothetical protein